MIYIAMEKEGEISENQMTSSKKDCDSIDYSIKSIERIDSNDIQRNQRKFKSCRVQCADSLVFRLFIGKFIGRSIRNFKMLVHYHS